MSVSNCCWDLGLDRKEGLGWSCIVIGDFGRKVHSNFFCIQKQHRLKCALNPVGGDAENLRSKIVQSFCFKYRSSNRIKIKDRLARFSVTNILIHPWQVYLCVQLQLLTSCLHTYMSQWRNVHLHSGPWVFGQRHTFRHFCLCTQP